MRVTEKEFVISSFERNFHSFCKEPIVIYGLGVNTGILVEAMRGRYHIIGLMDGARTGDIVFGLPVLSMDEVHAAGVRCVLILARAGNVPIIFARIAEDCARFGIEVYDINGARVRKAEEKAYELPRFYHDVTRQRLEEAIGRADVVSFDVFDTLLLRSVLQPTDVFDIIGQRAEEDGILPSRSAFARKRQRAEQSLYARGQQPTIEMIYQELACSSDYGQDTIQRLMAREMEEEELQLIARRPVVDIMRWALSQGKTICCTSDMYLPAGFLQHVFKRENIPCTKIFLSCEQGCSKGNGLFEVVKKEYAGKRILHIGDNEKADVEDAERDGIEAFFLPSTARMLADSRESELLGFQQTLADRLEVGRFARRVFENPFLFAETDGRPRITSPEELGEVYIEPMLASFCAWLIETCQAEGIEQLLLGARDGWVLTKMLDKIAEKQPMPFAYRYVYVSRAACTLAGMEDEEDVRYAASLAFAGTMEELLGQRFRLKKEHLLPREADEKDETYLDRHVPHILANVPRYRENYRMYLRRAGVQADKKTAFFDFVSSGTCQLWLEKILGMPLLGCYFLQLHDDYKTHLRIRSFYPKLEVVYQKAGCRLAKTYFFMENVMSEAKPSLAYIGEDGKLVFEGEKRTKEKMEALSAIHAGIFTAFDNRMRSQEGIPYKEIADDILSYVNREKSELQLDYFEQNILEDSYCNRRFSIDTMV